MSSIKDNISSSGVLYLIPNLLGEAFLQFSLPEGVTEIVRKLQHFIVEDEKSARKFLKTCGLLPPYNHIHFYRLDKHTSESEKMHILQSVAHTESGILSEAGCPAIADPGSGLVALAHQRGLKVRPLVGPSSILLALMASGGNGQGFSFHGYLPVPSHDRQQRIRELEHQTQQDGYTQIFIETPFRNEQLLADILKVCRPETYLSVSTELTLPAEEIHSKTIAEWQQSVLPHLKGRPAVFSLWVEGSSEKHKKDKYGKAGNHKR